MRAALYSVLLVGCGRLGFSEYDTPSPPDAPAARCTPHAETCNGIDDDCNGVIDEGCPCTPFDVAAPLPGVGFGNLIWTGQGYLVKSGDAMNITVQPIGATGILGTPQVLVAKSATYDATSFQPLAWSGRALAAVWTSTSTQVVLGLFDGNAMPLGSPVEVSSTPNGFEPSIVWAGDHFAAVWTDVRSGSNQVYLREFAADGTALTPELPLDILGATVMQILPLADHYLLDVGQIDEGSRVVEVTRDGTVVGTQSLSFPTSTTSGAHVAAGPGGFAAIRARSSTFDAAVIALDSHGVPTTPETPLPKYAGHTINVAAIAGAPSTYAVFGVTFANPVELVQIELDGTGAVSSAPELVTVFSGANGFYDPSVILVDHRRGFALGTGGPAQTRVIQQCR